MFAPLAIGGALAIERRVQRQARTDAAQPVAANVEDAAEEEAREDRDAVARWGS